MSCLPGRRMMCLCPGVLNVNDIVPTRQEAIAMNPNLSTSYTAQQATRDRLSAQAERGWLIEQAAAARPHRAIGSAVRQRLATALILAGERLQRRPRELSSESPGLVGRDALSG
jgi:hypothetical protein